ncbi:MAG TPA: methyltransferase domain-containing protein [Spirochaetia bacterium]|nr:methyltransferase domain-containing protein [Spirochaetia bacterium]
MSNNNETYVHGYSDREAVRLSDQANTLAQLLHHDTRFPSGSYVLEAGCGTGAQTVIVAPQNPDTRFVSLDISTQSLAEAKALIQSRQITNVDFHTGDLMRLNFPNETFDHVFVCFVLEHLPEPEAALRELKRVLKDGGSLTVIEGDHGSAFFYPESNTAREAIRAQVILQSRSGGNAKIGRELYPLLARAGFSDCRFSPRFVHADPSRPQMVEGFTRNTFTSMIEGVRSRALTEGIVDAETFDQGIRDLYHTAEEDGVFCYTFFKGIGYKR